MRRALWAAIAAGAGALLAPGATAQLPPIEPEPTTGPAPKARIAYRADGGIRTIAADGSDMRRLTASGAKRAEREAGDDEPAWSPDGRTIAFIRYPEQYGNPLIRLIGADGTGERALTSAPPRNWNEHSPAWSPDGERIAFARSRGGRTATTLQILSVRPDGGDLRVVHSETNSHRGDDVSFRDLAWSPDGQRILFTRRTHDATSTYHPSLHAVPVAGGAAVLLRRDAAHGAWSPDGARIAYAASQEEGLRCAFDDTCEPAGDIHVMNADSSGDARLTDGRADDNDPSWSPDGERVVFRSDRNALDLGYDHWPGELYSIATDGSCLTWLTNGTANVASPAWQTGPGLASSPGACGQTDREPLVETGTAAAERFEAFPVWWFGRVAPNGLLLTNAHVDGRWATFWYGDCGRFDPRDCGEPLDVANGDVCPSARELRPVGALTLARGALLQTTGGGEGYKTTRRLYTGRTMLVLDTGDEAVPVEIVDWLRRIGEPEPSGERLPATRLPRRLWRQLDQVVAAHRRLRDTGAVARRLGISRFNAKRRLALARRLDRLGVRKRLSC